MVEMMIRTVGERSVKLTWLPDDTIMCEYLAGAVVSNK